MEKLYGVEVDKDLIEEDDSGLYPQLSLLFWLTVGRDRVEEADNHKANRYREKHGEKTYTPDFNRTQNKAKIEVLEILKIPDLLELEGEELHNDSPAVKEWWQHIEVLMEEHYNTVPAVKRFLGLTLSKHETPIRALGKFVDRLGFTLNKTGKQTTRSETSDGKRHHIYKLERKCSKQDDIFQHWLNKLECDRFGLDDNQWELLTYFNDEAISLESKVGYFADILETMAIELMAIAPYIKEELLVDDLFLPLIKG